MEEPGARAVNAVRNIAVSGAAELTAKVMTLALTVVAARLLGPAGYGTFAAALALAQLLATLARWGFDPLVMREGAADRDDLPGLLGLILWWRVLAGLVQVVLTAGIVLVARPSDLAVAVLVAVGLVADVVLAQTMRTAAAVVERLGGVSAALVAQRLASAALGILGAFNGGVTGLAAGFALGNVLGFGLTSLAVRRAGVAVARPRGRAALFALVRRSLPLGLGRVASKALSYLDQLILTGIAGVAVVGTYAAVYRTFEALLFVSWAIERVVTPVIAADTATERASRLVHRSLTGVAVFYVPVAVGVWLEADRLLALAFGAEFATDGTPVAYWLAVLPLLYAGSDLVDNTYVARGRYWALLWLSTAAVVLNVALNLVLVPFLAGVGAAIASLAAYGLMTVVTVRYAQLVWWPAELLRGFAAPVLASAVMALALWLVALPVLLEVAVGAVIYGLAWLPLALRLAPEQVAMLRAAVRSR